MNHVEQTYRFQAKVEDKRFNRSYKLQTHFYIHNGNVYFYN